MYTDTSILTTTFVESNLEIVIIKIDFVSYYKILVFFLKAGHVCVHVNTSLVYVILH